MSDDTTEEILALSRRLLEAIDQQDWSAYAELCDPGLTAFEPEAVGQRVVGLEFHRFYFNLPGGGRPRQSTICSPEVRVMGDAALVTYVRLSQRVGDDGRPVTSACEETRIWHRRQGRWVHVHFHRSQCGNAS